MTPQDFARAASELVGALSRGRPHAGLSRRLGYRTNVVSDWAAGRRFPTAAEFLGACERSGVDVDAAVRRFHPATAARLRSGREFTPAQWLTSLRGAASLRLIATRTGLSRFAVARWFKGETQPRLPDFLRLIEAITDRVSDLADALVGIEKVPTLLGQHRRRNAARELAFIYPESEGMLRIMETEGYQALPVHRRGVLAEVLNIEPTREQQVLDALESAGIVESDAGRYKHLRPLTVDTSADPHALQQIKSHWTSFALKRLACPQDADWLGYNVMSLSISDLERVREILRDAYRQIRALAAASEPVEMAGLLNIQLVTFPSIAKAAPSTA